MARQRLPRSGRPAGEGASRRPRAYAAEKSEREIVIDKVIEQGRATVGGESGGKQPRRGERPTAPVNFRSGRDNANVGRSCQRCQRPDVTCDPNSGPRTAEQWFNQSCLSQPAQFTFGNAGAFIGEEDGRVNFDLSILKEVTIKERHRVQFRAEFFNLFNHQDFIVPATNRLTSSRFGQLTSTTQERQIQLALRYQF